MKDYREVQVSTTILVFIILGIIILGTVIFFMGVQVGKKQSELATQSLMATRTEEKVNQDKPVTPTEETAITPVQTPALNPSESPAKAVRSDTAGAPEVSAPQTQVNFPPHLQFLVPALLFRLRSRWRQPQPVLKNLSVHLLKAAGEVILSRSELLMTCPVPDWPLTDSTSRVTRRLLRILTPLIAGRFIASGSVVMQPEKKPEK